MPPPKLTTDAPITNIGEPIAIDLLPAIGYKARLAIIKKLITTGCQRFHTHKPLGGKQRLHRHLAPIGIRNAMAMGFHLYQ